LPDGAEMALADSAYDCSGAGALWVKLEILEKDLG
jgi:hypothetical protein